MRFSGGKLLIALETWGGHKNLFNPNCPEIARPSLSHSSEGNEKQWKVVTISEKYQAKSAHDRQGDTALHSKNGTQAITTSVPAGHAEIMPRNEIAPQIQVHKKLDTKPTFLNKSLLTRSTFRNRECN